MGGRRDFAVLDRRDGLSVDDVAVVRLLRLLHMRQTQRQSTAGRGIDHAPFTTRHKERVQLGVGALGVVVIGLEHVLKVARVGEVASRRGAGGHHREQQRLERVVRNE